VLPVDAAAEAIVALSRREGTARTYHLAHPVPIGYAEFVEAIRASGHRLESVPVSAWDDRLRRLRYEDDNPLFPLRPLFAESTDPILRRARLDMRNTLAVVPLDCGRCPPLTTFIPQYLTRLRTAGLLT
jgi:hypothetical protein